MRRVLGTAAAAAGLAMMLVLGGNSAALEPGREGMLFTRLGGDARGSSLGAAGAPLAEGRSAAFGNPAAGVLDRGYSVSLTHLQWVEGFFGETLSAQIPVGFEGVCGLSVLVFTREAIAETSEELPDGTGGLTNILNVEATLLGAQWMTDWMGVGASIRLLHEQYGETYINGFAGDLGWVGKLSPDLSCGASLRGLGRMIRAEDLRDPLPLTLNLGARYELPSWPVRGYLGGSFAGYGPSTGGVAVEVGPWLGGLIRTTLQLRERTGIGFAFGVGVRRDMWMLDYAFSPVSPLGTAHRFSLGVEFAAPRQR